MRDAHRISHFMMSHIYILLSSFKSQVTGALEAQIALVALKQKSKLLPGDMEFHPVTALHLESHIIGGGGMKVRMSVSAAVVVMGNIGPLCHNSGRNRQSGGMVIFVPFADDFHKNHHKCTRNQQEDDGEHDSEQTKTSHNTQPAKSGLYIVIHHYPSLFREPHITVRLPCAFYWLLFFVATRLINTGS